MPAVKAIQFAFGYRSPFERRCCIGVDEPFDGIFERKEVRIREMLFNNLERVTSK